MKTCRPNQLRRVLAAAAAVMLVALHQTGVAAPVTRTYNFAAANFTSGGSVAPPLNLVKGAVTVTFDTGVDQFGVTTGVVLNSLSLGSPGSALAFNYLADLDRLIVGGLEDGANGVSGALLAGNDFFVAIDGASAATPEFFQLTYGIVTLRPNVFSTFVGAVQLVADATPPPPPVSVPEPNSLALVLTAGLLLEGARLRRHSSRARRRGQTPLAAPDQSNVVRRS